MFFLLFFFWSEVTTEFGICISYVSSKKFQNIHHALGNSELFKQWFSKSETEHVLGRRRKHEQKRDKINFTKIEEEKSLHPAVLNLSVINAVKLVRAATLSRLAWELVPASTEHQRYIDAVGEPPCVEEEKIYRGGAPG